MCVCKVVCVCVRVLGLRGGCVWLSLTASEGAGFILALIMRERLAMPSSHFSFSSLLPVASGCFPFFLAFFQCRSLTPSFTLSFALTFSVLFPNSGAIVDVVFRLCVRIPSSLTSAKESWTSSWVWLILGIYVIALNTAWPFFVHIVNNCLSPWTTVLADLRFPTIALLILYQYCDVLYICLVAPMSFHHTTSYLISCIDSLGSESDSSINFIPTLFCIFHSLHLPLHVSVFQVTKVEIDITETR